MIARCRMRGGIRRPDEEDYPVVNASVFDYLVRDIDGESFTFALAKEDGRDCYMLIEYTTGKVIPGHFIGVNKLRHTNSQTWMRDALGTILMHWDEETVRNDILIHRHESGTLNVDDF